MAWRFIRDHREASEGNLFPLLTQVALVSGLSAFLVTYMFGDQNSSEWGYWIVGLMLAVATLPVVEELDFDTEETSQFEVDYDIAD